MPYDVILDCESCNQRGQAFLEAGIMSMIQGNPWNYPQNGLMPPKV